MAGAGAGASSSSFNRCFHCGSVTRTFKNGWKLSSGAFAGLCSLCGSAYENGTFCETFHWGEEGWSYCAGCKKMLHCGCIMSVDKFITLDFGGICCRYCEENHGIWEVIKSRQSSRAQHRNLPKVGLSVDSEEPVTDKAKADFISSATSESYPSSVEKSEKVLSEVRREYHGKLVIGTRKASADISMEGWPKIDG